MGNEVVIGIDLGTSNSCVSTVVDGEPIVIPNRFEERTTSSVVAFKEDGSVNVGNQAKAQVILDPRNTVSSAKRLIGRYSFSEEVRKAKAICRYEIVEGENHAVRIRVQGQDLSVPELSAHVLREMKSIAEEKLGRPVTGAVITVPAYFNDNQRQATKDAGRIAGLEVLRILNEPTAAALAYGYGKNLRQRVLVYDLGGGTFDVSVLEIEDDVYEVLSTCGDTYLGGDDFDDRLIDVLADKVKSEHGVNVRTDPHAFEKLKVAAERGKIELSQTDTTLIEIPDLAEIDGKTIGIEHSLSRSEFDKLCNDLIQRTFKVCDEAMQQAGLTTRDLDGVILVGGSTRLPTIRKSVEQYFQRAPESNINPDEVVALGAGIHAESLANNDGSTYLLDVTPLTLRLGIAGGVAEPIIEANSPVPIDHTRVFTTVQDYQETISVKIYQGEEREIAGNTLLGEFEFSGFEPGPRGQVQIEVNFGINTEGIVKVSARDPKNGVEASTTVSMSSGLSEEELAEIVARNQEHAAAAAAAAGSTVDDEEDGILPHSPATGSDEEEFLALPEVEMLEVDENEDTSEMFGALTSDLATDDALIGNAEPEAPAYGGTAVAEPGMDLTAQAVPLDAPIASGPPAAEPMPAGQPIELGGADVGMELAGNDELLEPAIDEELNELFDDDIEVMDAELLEPEEG